MHTLLTLYAEHEFNASTFTARVIAGTGSNTHSRITGAIDVLRNRMQVRENVTFTQEYYAPDKRYIGNAVQVFFRDGSQTPRVQVDFPIGHRKRREEGIPVLVKKFESSVAAYFNEKQAALIKNTFADRKLETMPVNELVATMVTNGG
jgi:2-methylcitrate dehydratase